MQVMISRAHDQGDGCVLLRTLPVSICGVISGYQARNSKAVLKLRKLDSTMGRSRVVVGMDSKMVKEAKAL